MRGGREGRRKELTLVAGEATRTWSLPSPLEGLGQRGPPSEMMGPSQAVDYQGSGRGRGTSSTWGWGTLRSRRPLGILRV